MGLIKDAYAWVVKWYNDYQPDPHPQVGDIYSGLRAPAGTRAKDVTSPCQYWVKGMPGICMHFQENKCSAEKDADGKYPTGYNNGDCDYLGRRSWCSNYDAAEEDLEQYICIAPDIFRTGLGKRDITVTTHLVLLPYTRDEILGYNDDNGVGKCDGVGMGRGKAGEGVTDPEKLYKLPVVCRHYKPWSMGFGAIKPRPMGTSILEGKNIYDGSSADPLSSLTRYLPFAFRMYNMRAQYQKCAYWNQDFGTDFEMDYSGGYASIYLSEDPLTECTCTDEASIPYKTIIDEWLPNTSDTLMDVLTPEKGIICNGAKPECPCYTGRWVYCVDDNMCDGMRITAEQILELRFWVASWQTKEIYDAIFAQKTGKTDITTSDIFTFDRWEKLGADVNESVMKGKRIYQCFPIPMNNRVFDSDAYLTKESVTYPKAIANTGTHALTTTSFPTLIRPIDETIIPYLNVIYPYSCKDPWNVVPCSTESASDLMEIASCNMECPATAIFGYTVRNKNVYALNISKIKPGINFNQFKKTMVSLLPDVEKEKMNDVIKRVIEESTENIEYFKYIVSGISDEYGYFGIGPLSVDYNTITLIAVICEINTTEYEVVVIEVESKLYGCTILQDKFELKYETTEDNSGYIITLPTYFGPAANLSGHIDIFNGNIHSIFPVYNKYAYGIMEDKASYSYCINEYTVNEEIIYEWTMVGPTGYIWAEINNINLSYLFDFEVISANIVNINEDKEVVCGDSGSDIELEVVFPKVDDPDAIKREHMLPNCVLLKAQKPQGFFNDDWVLYITYKYKLLETFKASDDLETEEVVWPSDLDKEGSLNKFVDVPFSLNVNGSIFNVDDIHFGTVAIMAYISDNDGRVQAAVATKMLCDVVTTRCRPIEISYSYKAEAVGYDLIPNSGFFTWVGGDKVLDGEFWHYSRPKCGDHDCNPDNCIGPMWFPFIDCTNIDFYSFYSGAATCTMPIEGQPRDDWRYRMADEYKAWVRPGGNWAASCGNGWYYSYSKAGESEFSGFGKIRTSVNLMVYSELGWTPPPFGNDGREITERWLSQEHYSFWDLSGIEATPRSEYMPLVFDDEMLFTSFNAFDEAGRIGPIEDCLHTTCMLNSMLSSIIEETVTEIRYRFENLFEVINHAWCMYPPPVYEGPGDTVTARRYTFKINDVAWAWREYWKDIERGITDDSTILNFVYFTKPDYYFDFEKTEHRLITDEGDIIIQFIAPKEGDEGYSYPEIFIDGGTPRHFKLLYDVYDDTQVEWVDEVAPVRDNLVGGGGEFGGGGVSGGWEEVEEGAVGGDFEPHIYENTMGDEWFHDYNTIFDVNASSEKSDDRKIRLTEDTYSWYNRGLIANIPKNRLVYLPYREIPTYNIIAETSPEFNKGTTWFNNSLFSKDIVFSYAGGGCVTRILINGRIGTVQKNTWFTNAGIYCKPEITIAECGMDDVEPCPGESGFPPTVLYTCDGERGDDYDDLDTYFIEIELSRLPKRMLYSSPMLKIKFTLYPNQSLILSGLPTVFRGEYVDAAEKIRVWEQKYCVSTGKFGEKNPDGEEGSILRSFDRDLKNAGQYFPTGTNSQMQESITYYDKMTMVGADEQYQEDIDVDISIGNLRVIERDEQKKLYETAYNKDVYDTMIYSIIIPPKVQQFFDANNMNIAGRIGNCNFTSDKLQWNDHEATVSFDQSSDFWTAGGHYFRWGAYYLRTRCYIAGPVETVYYPVIVHHRHGAVAIPWTPYEAYAGWGKLEYYEGKLDQAILLEKGITTGYDWSGGAGGFVMETFQ